MTDIKNEKLILINKNNMEIPEYDKNDLIKAEMDGDVYTAEFGEFITQLLERDLYNDNVEKGILAFVINNGTNGLSAKQKFRLQKLVDEYGDEKCKICEEQIPLNEVLDLDFNDGLCSYHKHLMDKDD